SLTPGTPARSAYPRSAYLGPGPRAAPTTRPADRLGSRCGLPTDSGPSTDSGCAASLDRVRSFDRHRGVVGLPTGTGRTAPIRRPEKGRKNTSRPIPERIDLEVYMCGDVLVSHTVPRAVPSALRGLTSGFGMGPGVSPSL